MSNPSLLILAGDGIGPEVMGEVKRIITAAQFDRTIWNVASGC